MAAKRGRPPVSADEKRSRVFTLRLTEDEDIPEIPVSSFMVAKAAAEIFAQMGKPAESGQWEARAGAYLKVATGQNIGTKRVNAQPYMGNIVAQTGSGPRWRARY